MIDSRCGLHCTGCSWKESHGCGGCIETQGHPFHGKCPIALCCQSKGLAHCGECEIIPCDKLYEYSYLDPEHGDKPQGARVGVCRKWAAESGKQVWSNVLLTSAGFEDTDGRQMLNIVDRFLQMLNKPVNEARILFIPTAAIDYEVKRMADVCRRQLINIGIKAENIMEYNIGDRISEAEVMSFDVIYLTGGNTEFLLKCIKENSFNNIIKKMVYSNKVYVGVSAGSIIATPNIGGADNPETAGLALIHAYISVHQPVGTLPRTDLLLPHIPLTDNQAIAVSWSGFEIIEG